MITRIGVMFAAAVAAILCGDVVMLAASQGEPWQNVEEPVQAQVPASISKTWTAPAPPLASKTAGERRGPRPVFEGSAGRRGRLDIFVKEEHSWKWRETAAYSGEGNLPVPLPEEESVGISLRPQGAQGLFFWAEVNGKLRDVPVSFRLCRNLRVSVPDRDAGSPLYLYLQGDDNPRVPDDRPTVFRLAPVSPALLCALGADGDTCQAVGATDLVAQLELPQRAQARVFLVENVEAAARTLAPGRATVLPRVVSSQTTRAGRWKAVSVPAEEDWSRLAVEWSCKGCPRVFSDGSTLPLLPNWSVVTTPIEKGLAVRPVLESSSEPLVEAEARLVFFLDSEGALGKGIPVAKVAGDSAGVFRAPDLPAGSYRMKLISAMSSGKPVQAQLEVGAVRDVRFGIGPVIRGRVIRNGSGPADEPAQIQVLRKVQLLSFETDPAEKAHDLADWALAAQADPAGRFRISLSPELKGPYTVRASWGHAFAEKNLVLTDQTEIDLGDIVLSSGGNLRGFVENCVGGEVRLAPLPQGGTAPFFDFRRISIGASGEFFAEGLGGGEWVVGGVCGGKEQLLAPEIVLIPEQGDAVVRFSWHASSERLSSLP